MQIADRMAADGYKDAGYEYVNVDDCWMAKQRGPDGKLQADPKRFPSGMKALGDYVSLVADLITRYLFITDPAMISWKKKFSLSLMLNPEKLLSWDFTHFAFLKSYIFFFHLFILNWV